MLTEFLTGKFVTIVGFTAALFSTYAFYRAAQSDDNRMLHQEWLALARKTFMTMFGALIFNGFHLLYLILSHQFQYNYVKHYSSTDLNVFYLVSTFYAGQEGSFMLWMFYGALLGIFVMLTAKEYEAPVMTVLALSQAFLLSMILGVDVPGLGMVGSDPFALALGEVPKEGDGLNPLLQNPWMVIHPPTLFVGFASLIVPFSYAVAALWKNKYDDWVRPAMPWVLFSAVTLGTGIMMGGYWAYKVLGWGGYWGWDPVENSSLVPWLFIVALNHTMIVQKKNGSLKRWNLFLAVFSFSAILYSAFLTRSGILGDTSVHSFTDLGLYNQLALFCGGFLALGVVMLGYRAKSIPELKTNSSFYSREFFLFCGSLVLMLIGLVVAAGTSTPIYSKITGEALTKIDADFYNKVTLPLAVLIGLFSAVGQLIWWKKNDGENLAKVLSMPLSLAMLFTSALVLVGVREIGMILLALTAAFSLLANAQVLYKVAKGNLRFAGGSLAHVGLGLMLLGILGSAKYDESKHVELPKGKAVEVFGKTLTYVGVQTVDGAKSGYKIDVNDGGNTFVAMPIMYETKRMTVQNPDVAHYLTKDFYIAPVNLMKRKNPNRLVLSADEPQTVHGYNVKFTGFKMYQDPTTLDANSAQPIKVGVKLDVTKDGATETIEPIFTIVAGEQPIAQPASLPSNSTVAFAVTNIDANSRKIMVEVDGVGPKSDLPSETLIVEASEKPFINVLWIGTYLVVFGFMISIYRRWKERKIVSRVSTQPSRQTKHAPEIAEVVE